MEPHLIFFDEMKGWINNVLIKPCEAYSKAKKSKFWYFKKKYNLVHLILSISNFNNNLDFLKTYEQQHVLMPTCQKLLNVQFAKNYNNKWY